MDPLPPTWAFETADISSNSAVHESSVATLVITTPCSIRRATLRLRHISGQSDPAGSAHFEMRNARRADERPELRVSQPHGAHEAFQKSRRCRRGRVSTCEPPGRRV
jgi:hypothetical protein